MKIRRTSLFFNNIISCKSVVNINKWYEELVSFRNSIIKSNIFQTGPFFYKINNLNLENQKAEFTFYMPIDKAVSIKDNTKYTYIKNFIIKDGLTIRIEDLENELEDSYEVLKECAQSNGLNLQGEFYNIYTDIYGEPVVDVYAPIEEGK